MSSFLDDVSDQLNLRWAWDKVRREATPGDIWFDEIELAGFDLALDESLRSIGSEFRTGRYRLERLRPLPFPKHPATDGEPRVRQAFQVSVRDQVAWTAVVNVVGPHTDGKMPAWSYGNRLFRSIWIDEDEDGTRRRKIGHYRHASGRLYLSFGQSYPVFRRHVYLTTRAMLGSDTGLPEMDERTQEEADVQALLSEEHRCPFVFREYWSHRRPAEGEPELYWCGVDLEKFYPSVRISVALENIVSQLPAHWRSEATGLLNSMLDFRLDTREWTRSDLKAMDLERRANSFPHVPTGLYVAGFLANAALLKVDMEVAQRLGSLNVAHFRFVDDHIMLAYRLDDLVEWVREYISILDNAGTGTRLNPEKVQPEALGKVLAMPSVNEKERVMGAAWREALSACRLDPEFPSPLMTKTLNLVSGIARIDFNLLEATEIAALTDQLEHLLLVEFSEQEMPTKTRLSFAATRLTRVVECRLANDDVRGGLACRRDALLLRLASQNAEPDLQAATARELARIDEELRAAADDVRTEVERAFQLIRKVLRERPDRIRLWTRAILMCRLTGAHGLRDLRDDVRRVRGNHDLAVEYLQANLLMIVGSQALVAARVAMDQNTPTWRREASMSFLKDVRATEFNMPDAEAGRSFLRTSWAQYCYGVYCADLTLRAGDASTGPARDHFFPPARLALGARYAAEGVAGHGPARWAWWAVRATLRDLNSHADSLVKMLGTTLAASPEAHAFWRFFPLDVPAPMLRSMILSTPGRNGPRMSDGWWFDALRAKEGTTDMLPANIPRGVIRRVQRVLNNSTRDTISLYEWCNFSRQVASTGSSDPRTGEWTALEIVRQIAALIDGDLVLDVAYLAATPQEHERRLCLHPANFRIPQAWIDPGEPTWTRWRDIARRAGNLNRVTYIAAKQRIIDYRYTPLDAQGTLFESVNPVRGLGLLLYGLLRKDLALPTLWNGPGHADVLGMLLPALLTDMTCSSWTLGVLQGCLQPRVTENLLLKIMLQFAPAAWQPADDTAHDPVAFFSAAEVAQALSKCQTVLEGCQLSTLEHRARQLTPMDIQQLTQPDWSAAFPDPTTEDNALGD